MSDATDSPKDPVQPDAGATAIGASSNLQTGAPVRDAAGFNPLMLARARRQLSLRELAKRSGVSAMTITFLENNELLARFNTLFALAEALNELVETFLPMLNPKPAGRIHKGGITYTRCPASHA